MKRTVLARKYRGVTERSDYPCGITRITIYTANELPGFARAMQNSHTIALVDLDVFEYAYRKGVERAEWLCRQVLGDHAERDPDLNAAKCCTSAY